MDDPRTRPVDQPRRVRIRGGHLVCTIGPETGRTWPVDRPRLLIGTRSDAEVVLTDPTVSRKHAEIVRNEGRLLLRDLGSTNGTWVGAVRVHEVDLAVDVAFKVGDTELRVTEGQFLEVRPSARTALDELVGASAKMREVFAVVERIAATDLTVLVTGETGTGKELVARALHRLSRRRDAPFVVFDAGSVASTLVEAQLFGHEKGAFTGAVGAREGVFEAARGGTVFLDEIGELPLDLQPKLLRVLERREVQRLGDARSRPVDVRVVAATNRNLEAEVKAGRFRSDLYFRLAVVEVELPPLRTRMDDLPLIVDVLLARFQGHDRRIVGVTDEVLEVLRAWRWPGNVRELANVIQRAIPFTDGPRIDLSSLPPALTRAPAAGAAPEPTIDTAGLSFKDAREKLVDAFERRYFEDLWAEHHGNISALARVADLDRKSVRRILRKHGIANVED